MGALPGAGTRRLSMPPGSRSSLTVMTLRPTTWTFSSQPTAPFTATLTSVLVRDDDSGHQEDMDKQFRRLERLEESLAKIDEALRSGAIDKKEYDRRKARIMDAYWQRENTRRHQSADSFHGSSRDRAISP